MTHNLFYLLAVAGLLAQGEDRLALHLERLSGVEVLRMLLAKELVIGAVVDNLLSWHHSGSPHTER